MEPRSRNGAPGSYKYVYILRYVSHIELLLTFPLFEN